MTDTTKKERERRSLEAVYPVGDLEQVKATERPDFVCTVSESHHFGVEVTEFFETEAQARMQRIPGYGLDLLCGGAHRHKDDVLELKVEEVIHVSGLDGRRTNVKAFFRKTPPIQEVFDLIAQLSIIPKNLKLAGYQSGLSACDLIVTDCSGWISGYQVQDVVRALIHCSQREAIDQSPFREIHLVSTEDRRAFRTISLKQNLLAAEIYAFQIMYKEFYCENLLGHSWKNYLNPLGWYLQVRFPYLRIANYEERPEFLLGSTGCHYRANGKLLVRDTAFVHPDEVDYLPDVNFDAPPREFVEFMHTRREQFFCCFELATTRVLNAE
ncbi:MAG: hypothetical protein KDA86_01750 [Planctomycetaceae bacterium]|nr:hypothetical protein [Planctomycetaceae bacterium]